MPDLKGKQWLHHLYMQAPVAISIYTGKEYIIELANPKMCEIWGRRPEQVLNKPLFAALPEVSEQGFEEILADVFKTGKPFTGNELPATLERKGRLELTYFNVLYEPFRDENNNILGVIQVATEVTELVEARKQAERNEEVLRVALKAGKMGTWHMDLIRNILSCSPECDRIFGYQEMVQDWSIDNFVEHVVPEDKHFAVEKLKSALKDGYINFEVRIRWPDKSIHWAQLKGEVSYNLKNRPVSISGIILDITDQKMAVEEEKQMAAGLAAREEAERQNKILHDLFMEAPALICTLRGPEHIFELVNPQYQQIFPGRSLRGKPILEALPEIKGQPIMDVLDDVYRTGKTFIGNEVPILLDRFNTNQLVTSYFNFVYQTTRDAGGAINGILVFAFEVTGQIEARKHVERSEENLRIALEAGKMGTWNLDLLHNTSTRSLQHDHIFGYDSLLPEWGFKQFIRHVLPQDREMVTAQFDKARKSGELFFEARILRADKKESWIAVKGCAFYEDGKPVRMAGVVMDITDRKKTEEQLQRLTKELSASNEEIQSNLEELSLTNNQLSKINADLDNFVYTASHDLKAPISNIEGLVQSLVPSLSSESLENEKVKKHISLIQTSVERFKKTIKELTDIAHLQKEVQKTSLTNLYEVIEEVQMDLQPLISESKAQIEINVSDCFYVGLSYKNVKSIIFNLLSNAIKYHSPERIPNVRISCQQDCEFCVLNVQDNGLGISEMGKSKIFLMFNRLHTHVEGSGVGLYLVKRMVDNAGGKLEVESEEGKGSTFKVYLPIASYNRKKS